jgi:hypothetical protein
MVDAYGNPSHHKNQNPKNDAVPVSNHFVLEFLNHQCTHRIGTESNV